MSSYPNSTAPGRDPLDPEVARPDGYIDWRYDVRERVTGAKGAHDHPFCVYGGVAGSGTEYHIGCFAFEELGQVVVDDLRMFDSMQGVGFDVLSTMVAPQTPREQTAGPWTLHKVSNDGQCWWLNFDELDAANFRGSGSLLPQLLFDGVARAMDLETPRAWKAEWDRESREEYLDTFTKDPVDERVFRSLHQLEKETGKSIERLYDSGELCMALLFWRGYELPASTQERKNA